MSKSSPDPSTGRSQGTSDGPPVVDGQAAGRRDDSHERTGRFSHDPDGDGASWAEATRESERWFRDLANTMPQIVWTASPDGAVDYFNSRWYEYSGMTLEASLGEGWRASVHPDDLGRFSAERDRGLGDGEVFEGEIRLRHRSGDYRWHLVRSAPVKDGSGRVGRRSGTATDIDDRRSAEAALRESERRFARFMRHLPGLAWIKDAEGRYVYANDAAERAFGTPRSDLYGRTDEQVFPPETAAQFRENDRRALEAGAGVQVVETLEHEDGDLRHSLVSKFPIPGPDGEAGLVGGMAIDISERLRAEEAIRASEGRFRHLADAMPQMVWITRPDRSVEYVNRRWLDYTGQTPEAALGPGGWQSAIHPEDLGRIVEASVRSHATGEPFEAEYRVKDASGAFRWHLGRAVAIFDESGRLARRFGVATDIDDRRRAEDAARFLAEASATLSALVDEAGTLEKVARLAVPTFADWCSVDMVNEGDLPRRLAVAHIDPAKVEFAHDLHRRYPPDPDALHGVSRVIRTGESLWVAEITEEMMTAGARDADHFALVRDLGLRSYLCVPLKGHGGTLGAITFVAAESGRRYGPDDLRLAEDLASRAAIAIENARLYAELREADRRKDEFLATLAHELRNPLAPIRNALHLMRHPDAAGDGHEEVRAMAERQVVRLSLLVDDLMDVARISKGKLDLKRQVVGLGEVVSHAVEAVRSALADRGHELVVEPPAVPVFLEADPTRLEQVLDNLLTNAIKYTEPGGRIVLSAGREGGEAVIRVADSGIGIPPEMLPRVFEMFAQVDGRSTRTQGGLGIGLGLVKGLVEMHGGTIRATSGGPGSGSEFVVRLPAIIAPFPGAADGRRAERDGEVPELPCRRLLVVDDNVDAANSLAKVLRRIYKQDVRAAHGGPEALAVAGDFRPEVVLLDIGMPGMDGYEVARRLRSSPDSRAALLVALTGWGQESDRRRAKEAGFDHHLVKPVDPEAIRALLADPALPVLNPGSGGAIS